MLCAKNKVILSRSNVQIFLPCLQNTHLGSGSRNRCHIDCGSNGAISLRLSLRHTPPAPQRGWWGWSPGWSRWSAVWAACWYLRLPCFLPGEMKRRNLMRLVLHEINYSSSTESWTHCLSHTLRGVLQRQEDVLCESGRTSSQTNTSAELACAFFISWDTPTGPKMA